MNSHFTSLNYDEITFKAPLPGHFLGTFLSKSPAPTRDVNSPPLTTPPSSRSQFDLLADEIKLLIISLLDPCTACDLRLVSRSLNSLVNANLNFQTIKSSPKLLKSVYVLQCRFYTLSTLASNILENKCSCCYHYGDYLYLPTAERLCYECFREQRDYVPKPVSPSSPALGALRWEVPTAVVQPGCYGMYGLGRLEEPQLVIDRRYIPLINQHIREQQSQSEGEQVEEAFYDSEPETPRQEWMQSNGTSHLCGPHAARAPLAARYTVVIPAPYWDSATRTFKEGVFCKACARKTEKTTHPPLWKSDSLFWEYPYRRYAGEEGIRKHLEECGAVERDSPEGSELATYIHTKPPSKKFVRPGEMVMVSIPRIFHGFRDKGHSPYAKYAAMEKTLHKSKAKTHVFSPQYESESSGGGRTEYSLEAPRPRRGLR